jgi:hypothetical protein
MARKPTDMVQLKLRFSEALRRRLERAAARNNRSMNTEIIHRLQGSFAFEAGTAQASRDRKYLSEMRERLDEIIALLGRAEEAKDDGEQQ